MNRRLVRIGIIGCGYIGGFHASRIQGDRPPAPETGLLKRGRRLAGRVRRLLRGTSAPTPMPAIEGTQIVAASDIDKDRLARFGGKFNVPQTHTNYEELLARKDVDAVLICTPPTLHAEITVKAARQGKHIFCEKPMAMTSQDCIRMIAAAKEAGVVLQIGYVLRFSSERGRIRDAVLNGEIGRPVFVREIGNLRAGSSSRWVHDDKLGGGVLWEHSHDLDFLRHVFGDPDLVFGVAGRYKPDNTSALDTIAVVLTFPSGDKAMFTDSNALRGFGGRRFAAIRTRIQIDVMGPKGFLQYPDGDSSQKLTVCVYGDPEDRVEKMPWSADWGANGYRKEIEHFVDCVREGKTPEVPGEEGLRTVQLLETVIQSFRTGEACKFAPSQ